MYCMKITKYRMEQLDEARQLQKECIKNHLPCPPVAWWQAKILDSNGKIEEQIESKCNSYVRNGLNLIAMASMPIPNTTTNNSDWGNGIISIKQPNNNMCPSFLIHGRYFRIGIAAHSNNQSTNFILNLGTGSNAESLDSYELGTPLTSSGWTRNLTIVATYFDSATNKLISSLYRTMTNTTGESVNLTESGIYAPINIINGSMDTTTNILFVRDVFQAPITLDNNKSITFTYNFELLYPQ